MNTDGDWNRKHVACVILAAGSSERFGSDKRQALSLNRRPLLQRVLATYRPHFDTLAVVVPSCDEVSLSICTQFAALALENPNADKGVSASLCIAATWLETQVHIHACVIGLADMPLISSQIACSVRDLVMRHDEPVITKTATRLGFPRALPRRYFPVLAQLHDESGARDIFEWSRAVKLNIADKPVLLNVDAPQNLDNLRGESGAFLFANKLPM